MSYIYHPTYFEYKIEAHVRVRIQRVKWQRTDGDVTDRHNKQRKERTGKEE